MSTTVIRKEDFEGDIISEVPSSNAELSVSAGRHTANSQLQSSYNEFQDVQNFETIPPKPNSDYDIFATTPETEKNTSLCCCFHSRGGVFQETAQHQIYEHSSVNVARCLRKCLSSAGFYLYLLMSTFCLVVLLLAELLLDVGVIVVPDEPDVVNYNNSPSISKKNSLILILHWFNFSILCIFFVEVALRVLAWRSAFLKSLVAIFDAAAVIVAFSANLVTTLIAGYNSPFNAISLLVILRFMRIYSLIQSFVQPVKRNYKERLNKTECFLAELQVNGQRLLKQISEKDYEIRQLQAHLSSLHNQQDGDTNFYSTTSHDDYETQLEKALVLSKRQFEEETGVLSQGHVNHSFVDSSPHEDELLPSITIHHRENSIKRDRKDRPSTSKDGAIGDFKTDNRNYAKVDNNDVTAHGHYNPDGDNDASALLHTSPGRQHWTVGYCVIQDSGSLSSAKSSPAENRKRQHDALSRGKCVDPEVVNVCEKEATSLPEKELHESYKGSIGSAQVTGGAGFTSGESYISSSSIYAESGYQSDDRPVLSASSTPKRMPFSCTQLDQDEADKVSISTVISNPPSPSRISSSSSTNVNTLDFNDKVDENQQDAL